jgi:hypothetical protein
MLGIVQARTALASSKAVGIRNVSLQYLSMTAPMTTDPVTLPSRPTIIEKQTAVALKRVHQKLTSNR